MKTDLEKNGLLGEIKQIKEDMFNAIDKFGEVVQTTLADHVSLIKFDESGNIIEENHYHIDGNLSDKSTFRYDDSGNQIETNSYNSDGDLEGKGSFKYDQKGNRIEGNYYNSGGSLFLKAIYNFDDMGNQIGENRYSSDGSLISKEIYKYDTQNNKIETNDYDIIDDSITCKITSKYNEKGNLIEMNRINTDVLSFLNEKNIYKYDDRGRMLEQNSYKEEGPVTYKFEYDFKNNWIKKIHYKNDIIPEYITIREITYI